MHIYDDNTEKANAHFQKYNGEVLYLQKNVLSLQR